MILQREQGCDGDRIMFENIHSSDIIKTNLCIIGKFLIIGNSTDLLNYTLFHITIICLKQLTIYKKIPKNLLFQYNHRFSSL